VFYISDADGFSGLEAAPVDQSAAEWGCNGKTVPGANGTGIGTGKPNTEAIVAFGCVPFFNPGNKTAAIVADEYSLNGTDDWFLPSLEELGLLYDNKDIVGGFTSTPFPFNTYWSSTESNIEAWAMDFGDGTVKTWSNNNVFRVRPIREF
jgi:hypothetical protein